MTWYATLLPDDLGDTDQGESHDHVRVEIDRLLEQGLKVGDWEATRTALRVAPKEATSHEGYHLGLATAAFYVDHEAAAAEQSLTEAINCPSSQWRPDSYRLQAIILQALGRNEEAAKAVEQGIFAVEKLSLDDEAKARYRTWVGQALVDPNKQLVAGATIKGPELLDTLLTEASATDDWAFCRKRIDESFQGHSDLEGLCYARAQLPTAWTMTQKRQKNGCAPPSGSRSPAGGPTHIGFSASSFNSAATWSTQNRRWTQASTRPRE